MFDLIRHFGNCKFCQEIVKSGVLTGNACKHACDRIEKNANATPLPTNGIVLRKERSYALTIDQKRAYRNLQQWFFGKDGWGIFGGGIVLDAEVLGKLKDLLESEGY